jgi:hypothetical protein
MSLSMSDDAVKAFRDHLAAPKEGDGRRPLPQTDPFEGYDPASDPVLQPATPAQLRAGTAAPELRDNAMGQIMAAARHDGDAKRSKPVVDAEKLYADHATLSKIRAADPTMYYTACCIANIDNNWRIDVLDEPTTAKLLVALDSLLSTKATLSVVAEANRNYRPA